MDTSFESVPRYCRLPQAVLRAQLRSAGLAILATGATVSVQRLREHGVREGPASSSRVREELVAAGELPPGAAARVYARPVHPPGKAAPPPPDPDAKPTLTRAQRRIRRLVRRYNRAVRNIFGRDLARQIGAAPSPKPPPATMPPGSPSM